MDAATIVNEVAAIEVDAANAAVSAEVAASAADQALMAAAILTDQVEQASQAAAVAIVDEVHTNTERAEWNTERLDLLHREMSELRTMVLPLQATMESLVASVALLVNNSSSAVSQPPAPVTPSPESGSVDAPPDQGTPPVVAPEPEVPPSPARKEKRFRLMR